MDPQLLSTATWQLESGPELSTAELLQALWSKRLSPHHACRSATAVDWRPVAERFRIVGPYGVFRSLGEGAFGEVYLALDLRHGELESEPRLVALKTPTAGLLARHATLRGDDTESLDRARHSIGQVFSQESVLTARLAMCPHVVAVLDHDVTLPYMVTEFCDGGSLAERMEQPYDAEDALRWVTEICRALDAAQSLEPDPLVHRDLKPDNVLIKAGVLKVADFGTSKMVDRAVLESLRGGFTPAYAAPESFDGQALPATDLWSLGVIAYELFAGRRPFEGNTLPELMTAIATGLPSPLEEVSEFELPPGFSALVSSCLEKDPDARPSAEDCLGALEYAGDPLRFSWPLALGAVLLLLWGGLWGGSQFITKRRLAAQERARFRRQRARLDKIRRPLTEAKGRWERLRQSEPSLQAPKELVQSLEGLQSAESTDPKSFAKQEASAQRALAAYRSAQGKGTAAMSSLRTLRLSRRSCRSSPRHQASSRRAKRLEADWRRIEDELKLDGLLASMETINRLSRSFARLSAWQEARPLLGNRQRWSAAPSSARGAAVAAVVAELGEGYRSLGMARYSCGGQSFAIATILHIASGAKLNIIPGGPSVMGSKDGIGNAAEFPAHRVKIAPFLIGRFEVRQAVWDRVGAEEDARRFRGADLPIESVSWSAVQGWLKRAGGGLRLPSEAEWEYAARSGTESRFFWGGERVDERYAWYGRSPDPQNKNPDETRQVTLHSDRPNAFGLVDMAGNVWEFCQDGWVDNYRDGPVDSKPRLAGGEKVIRGGAWNGDALSLRPARRSYVSTSAHRTDGIGFRLARSLSFEH